MKIKLDFNIDAPYFPVVLVPEDVVRRHQGVLQDADQGDQGPLII